MEVPEAVISLIITSVFAGIAYGYKVLWGRITTAADQCEKDRLQLWGKANELSDKVKDLEDRLEDCPKTDCPARPLTPVPHRPDHFRIAPIPRQLPGTA